MMKWKGMNQTVCNAFDVCFWSGYILITWGENLIMPGGGNCLQANLSTWDLIGCEGCDVRFAWL